MNLAERVFICITTHWREVAKERLVFFAGKTWHSYEEWLNWDAAYACHKANLHVWPKALYSACKFKMGAHEFADLAISTTPFSFSCPMKEAVIVETALVHGNSQSEVNDKVRHDWHKFAGGDLTVFTPLQIIIAVSHPQNPQGKAPTTRFLTNEMWIEPTPLSVQFPLPGGGVCEVKGWTTRKC